MTISNMSDLARKNFTSVSQALALILREENTAETLKAVVCANIDFGEYGFASELITAFGNVTPGIPNTRSSEHC